MAKNKKSGRPKKLGRTRFDAMVDLDLRQKANEARLAKPNPDSWPELTERMLRFLEGGVSTHDLTTALELTLDALESEITSEYNAGSKRHKEFLKEYEPIRQTIKRAKWLEYNRR